MNKQITIEHLSGVSEASVKNATGKTWGEWIVALDRQKAALLAHKEIVKLLEQNVDNAWWRQKIAMGYEEYIGARVLGQTATGFQIGVRRTVHFCQPDVWEFLISEEGIGIWLGETSELNFTKGGTYVTKEGISGKIKVLKDLSHVRMSWKPAKWAKASTLQIRAIPKGDKTTISFHQENLPGQSERDMMKQRWSAAIEEIVQALTVATT